MAGINPPPHPKTPVVDTRSGLINYEWHKWFLAINRELNAEISKVEGGGGSETSGVLKNSLINGNFDFWQRGTSSTTSDRFLADRWFHSFGPNGLGTVSRQSFTVGQTEVPGEPQYFWRQDRTTAATTANVPIYQRIESVRTFAGQQVTWSFWAKVGSGTKTFTPAVTQRFGSGGSSSNRTTATAITLTTTWTKFIVNFDVPSISLKTIGTNDSLSLELIEFSPLTTFTLDFARSQFEQGNTATEFEDRHFETELGLCQRYYEKSYDIETTPGTVTSNGQLQLYSSTTTFRMSTEYQTAKRAIPTVNIFSPATGTLSQARVGGSDQSASVEASGNHGFGILVNSVADGTLVSFHYEASSEL